MTRPLVVVGSAAILVVLVAAVAILLSRTGQDSVNGVLAGGIVDRQVLPVVVPYREIAGAIVIDVRLGDETEAVPMVLDTGAPTAITPAVAAALGADRAGSIDLTSADGRIVPADVVTLPRLAIGPLRFVDVGAVITSLDEGDPFACLTQAGFIGASLMRDAVWQFDPRSHTVTIVESVEGLDHIEGADRLRLTPASAVSPSPLVELPVGEGSLSFLLDTGFAGWLAVHPDDAAGVGLDLPTDALTVAIRGSSIAGPFITKVQWLTAVGGSGARTLTTTRSLPPGRGLAGTDYLSRFVVTIDWANETVYLAPIADPAPSAPPSASLAWDEGYVLGSLVEGWPGTDGLALGASVAAIDGEDVSAATFDDYCAHLVAGPQRYTLTLAGSEPRDLVVEPAGVFLDPLR